MSDETRIWVKTEPTLDGKGFMVTVEFSEDIAVALDPSEAHEFVEYMHYVAAIAEYEAAVLRQLTSRGGVNVRTAGQVILDMRRDRAPLGRTWPVIFTPGVAQRNQRGFITIETRLTGLPLGQTDPEGMRRIAGHILEALVVADLDAGYLRELIGVVGLKEATARTMVEDLGKWRDR